MAQAPGSSFFETFIKKYGPKRAPAQPNAGEGDVDPQTGKPKVKGQQSQSQDSSNPLDLFGTLFDSPTEEDTKKKAPPAFHLTPEAISKAAEKMDFTAGLPPELSEKLKNGYDPEAMMAAIQHAGRSAYARAMEHGTSLTDKYIGIRLNHEQQGLGDNIRKYLAGNSFDGNSSGSDNPVVRKHRKLLAERLATEFPEASPQEIAELTDNYYVEMARLVRPDAFSGDDRSSSKGNTKADGIAIEDWGAYLENQASGGKAGQGQQPNPAATSQK